MHFEIHHDFDAPLDAIELAVLSPDTGPRLCRALSPTVASIETRRHELEDGELRRVLRFQASAPLAIFRGVSVATEALQWEMHVTYRLASHASTWEVLPREQYRRYFHAHGTYQLEPMPHGRCRRTVAGDMQIGVPTLFLRKIVERMALAEVRSTYDAEARMLRELATL